MMGNKTRKKIIAISRIYFQHETEREHWNSVDVTLAQLNN